ncbi:MAG: hypothetical protein PVG39_13900 [Desulfobacteraceae bacterium]
MAWTRYDGDTWRIGEVGIGTDNPDTKLHIKQTSTADIARFENAGNSPLGGFVYFYDTDNSGVRGFLGYGPTLFTGLGLSDFGIRSQGGIALGYAGGTNMYIDTSGNVGIGTTSPQSKLHVYGPGTKGEVIETSSNTSYSYIKMASINNNGYLYSFSESYSSSGRYHAASVLLDSSGTGGLGLAAYNAAGIIRFYTNGINERMRIDSSGNVGIGTTNPGSYKLAVEGKIGAREVVVTQAAWADHVFNDNYTLPSLEKVESYIKENKHLPDIPSAKEVEEEGLSMADMMKKQMQKIEELTLYVIDQNKKLETVINENEQLKSRMAELESERKN